MRDHFQEMKDKVQYTQSTRMTSEARTKNSFWLCTTEPYFGTLFKHGIEIGSNRVELIINYFYCN